MPLLGFKKQFAPAVENGTKRQTIRARRKNGRDPKPGDTLYLYAGLRTKQCRKLGEGVCRGVEPITIEELRIRIGDRVLVTKSELDAFAKDDGFGSFYELVDYFQHEMRRDLPWSGIVIYWIPR